MKKTLLFVAMMLCCAMTMFAQNDKISYQAVVRDTENKLVANKSVQVTVNIYNGTATTAAYTETQTVTTNLNGLISLQIGPNGTNAGWNSIEWNKARIETTVKLNGTELGTLAMPLTAVPYAMYAKYADNVDPDALAAQMHDTANNVRGEMNNKLADKANVADVYTKAQTNVNIHDTAEVVRGEMNNKLADKANIADVYTKAQTNVNIHDTAEVVRGEMNNKLADKANVADVYTKAQTNVNIHDTADVVRGEMNNKLADKANVADVYTKAQTNVNIHDTADVVRGEMNNKLADKANVADVYTKAQTNVNIHDTADVVRAEITALSNNYYTKTQVNNLAEQYIQQLTNTLNTLNGRIDSVINVMNNLPTRMVEQRDTVQTAGQTSFTLAHEARADCVVRMYINGVMVGGNYNDVVTVSNTTVTYDPTKNGNYALKADDKVTIVYWY